MTQDRADIAVKAPHNVTIENRSLLSATGITAIIAYDEYAATLDTAHGTIIVGGTDIHVSELSMETGEVKVHGKIEYVQYQDKKDKPVSIFKRLTR